MDPSGASRRKAEQYLSVAEKLLVACDFEGCKQFCSQALATDPNTPGGEELHAAASVLAAERRRLSNGKLDPYAILGLDSANPASRHPDAIDSHFRRLSFLLNRPRPNRPFSLAFTNAAGLVVDAGRVLSDPVLKSALDADLDAAAAAAAAARAYQYPAPNRPPPQSPLSARPHPPFASPPQRPTPAPAVPPPRPTPPPTASPPRRTAPFAAPTPRSTPLPAAPFPRSTPPRDALASRQTPPLASGAPRPTPLSVASSPKPQTPPATSSQRSTPPPAGSLPRPTPPPAGSKTRPTPPARAPQTSTAAIAPPIAPGTPPSSTFWTVCTACRHIHQYDRLYEKRKLQCPSCRQSFVADAMAEPPPIVPGTDMYYCTWGFFPVGFPGCPGFERLVNSQAQGPDQLNAPWLRPTTGANGDVGDVSLKGDAAGNAENGVPVSATAEIPIEVPATTPPAKPMRVKVGAKKRGRPKGSKNKNKM